MKILQTNVQELKSNWWYRGWALDIHTISSVPMPDGGFDTQRTELGQALFLLKYRGHIDQIQPVADTVASFLKREENQWWFKYVSGLVPVPPSKFDRSIQPVWELAGAISIKSKIRCDEDFLIKTKDTEELKNIDLCSNGHKNLEEKMKKSAEYIWFRLWRTNGIGPGAFAFTYNYLRGKSISIMEMTGSNRPGLLKNFPELKPIISKLDPKDKDAIIKEYNEIKEAGLTIVHPDSEYYPENFIKYVERIGASPIFFCKGNLSVLKNNGIAVVGSRNVSEEGINITKGIASTLARGRKNIVSGYAKGVDTAAHIGALEARGTTTLVLSYGINEFRVKKEFRNYDFENDVLIVTQFLPDEKWMARRAMTRNKLISALSEAVIVIESGPERDAKGRMSGTFDSARTVLKMGGRLFVLSPSALKNKPVGNSDIIKIGGQEIFPGRFTADVLEKVPGDKEERTKKEFARMELNFEERGAVEIHR